MKIKLADMSTIGTPETLNKTFIKRVTNIYRNLLRKETFLLVTSSAIFLPAIWVLPFFSDSQYSIINNTVGELGAAGIPGSWIINLLMITLAIGSLIAGWGHYQGKHLERIILLLNCTSLLLSGIFNEVPINDPNIDKAVADWHEYFEATYSLSFILLGLVTAFLRSNMTRITVSLISAFSVMIIKVITAESDFAPGILDRFLFIIMIFWLLNTFIIRESQKPTETNES